MQKKFHFLRLFFLVCMPVLCLWQQVGAQETVSKQTASDLIAQNAGRLHLSAKDEQNLRVSDVYVDKLSGAVMVYATQTFKGIDVYNTMQVMAFKDGKLVSLSGGRIQNMESVVNSPEGVAKVQPADAVKAATVHLKLSLQEPVLALALKEDGQSLSFGKLGISKEDITTTPLWYPTADGKVTLGWQVYVAPNGSSDYWHVKVDATNGTILGKDNETVNCNWTKPAKAGNLVQTGVISEKGTNAEAAQAEYNFGPEVVTGASYNVVPFPVEAPSFPGGTPSLQTDPWNLAGVGNNATSLLWNYDGTTYYDATRGNNVYAATDTDANNIPDMTAPSLTPEPTLSFNYIPQFNQQPNTPNNKNVAMTDLFYWNNIMHDMSYQYGFDEVSGNFQADNQGRKGIGNDFVYADAQDGSGTNNANFATPVDGSNPRMQMFLWSGVATGNFVVNSPADIAGPYTAVEGALSTNNLLANVGPVTANIVNYSDQGDGYQNACVAAGNSAALKGKIALINRSTCTFVTKIDNAQAAGAIGVIMVDSIPQQAPIVMGGSDNTITIPAVMISMADGSTIRDEVNVNVTLKAGTAIEIDGDMDAGVMCHEYTHGISNRLTGGPSNTSCLANAEQMGEGWSDYDAIMITTDWSKALLTDGTKAHPLGTYVIGETPSGSGIREYPYSTNMTINPHTYADVATSGGEVHAIGEIWTTMLWDMTWDIIQQDGLINTNFFDATAAGGNTVAMKLMYEGLKLQPCSPGFVDGRNAILNADTLLYGGKYSCSIWKAFAGRGVGINASEGSSNSYTDQTVDFTVPASCETFPVVWGNFTAAKKGNTGALNWNTLQEINTNKFVVERSTDGINFSTIGTVAALGNSSTSKSYSFTDVTPLNGTDYYRLKHVDKDGSFVYSAVRSLTFYGANSIVIAPNPAKDVLNVTVSNNTQLLNLYFVNAEGQTLRQYTMTDETQQLSLPQLSAGIYYLKIVNASGNVTTHKVVIQ